MTEANFEFEKLDVHAVALKLLPVLSRILDQLPRGYGDLADHARRSGRSIHLNIAEGAGKYRRGAKVQRYATARASANECASALKEIRLLDLADRKSVDEALDLLNRICAMLTKLIVRWDPKD